MAPNQQQGIALNVASQGGLLDDADVEILDAAFCEYDYGGAIDHNVFALGIQMRDTAGKTYDQYYSAGELVYFVPSADGSMAVPVGDKQQLSDTCNAWKFLLSIMECRDEMNAILGAGNVKALIGLKCHVKQYAQPKRQGLIRGGKNPDREPTVLLVSAILALPGEKQAAAPARSKGLGAQTGRPTPAAAPSAQAAAGKRTTSPTGLAKSVPTSPSKPNGQAGASAVAADDQDKAIAAEILFAILAESASGSVTKKDLARLAFQHAGAKVAANAIDAKAKGRIVPLIFQDSFLHELAAQGAIGEYDGQTVSLPA
jgi:hypothetical protein